MNLVLNYGPKHAHRHERADRIYLVWPVAAWRVLAPLPTDRKINILQKAVLGICRSASCRVEEIAVKLHLHPRLIEVIGMELVGSGWVDQSNWRPTPKGLAMLETEESAMDDLVSGWVFQNPWTGDLWPFFSRQLQLQETALLPDRNRLALVLDSSRGTRKAYAWTFDSPPSPGQPSPESILTALRRFRRREKLKGSMRLLDAGLDQIASDGPTVMLSRIAFISEQPEPAGLATFGYLPEGGGMLPQICDPFGFGCDSTMWRQLQRLAASDEGAAAAQREFLRLAHAQSAPDLEQHLANQRLTAEAELVAHLTLDIKSFPAVFQHLVDATHILTLADASPDASQGHLASVLQFCRQVLEALLKQVAARFPPTNVHLMLGNDPTQDLTTLNRLIQGWGYKLPIPIEFQPKKSGAPNKGSVKKACEDLANFYLLPSAVLATVLAATQQPAHPLRQAAARDPQLLDKLASIIKLGNAGSHDDSHDPRPRRFTMAEATEMHNLTMQVTALLLGLPFKES